MPVYLDNAATTPLAHEVIEVMTQVMANNFGNPSSSHSFGRETKALVETSRRSIAKHLNCNPSEIIFTSGGTEADNLALYTSVQNLGVERIISTTIEHHAVGYVLEHLQKQFSTEIIYLPVDNHGRIALNDLEQHLRSTNKKTLVSLMHANNEIGTLQPIDAISILCRTYGALLHSDTVQTMGHYRFNLQSLDIDFITCAAHKFHGPKGVGFLYSNKKNKIAAMLYGGSQERGLRGGTENLYGIVGMAKAMDLAYHDTDKHQRHVYSLKEFMIQELTKHIPDIRFHGDIHPDKSLYTVLNVSFPVNEKAGTLLFTLDLNGVAASGGSACSSGANQGSHVLKGIGADLSRPNVRFSFSRYTTMNDVIFAVEQIKALF